MFYRRCAPPVYFVRYGLGVWRVWLIGVVLCWARPAGATRLLVRLPERAAASTGHYLSWVSQQSSVPHPEAYRFRAEMHEAIAKVVSERPGIVAPFVAGRTVKGLPIWAFRILNPVVPTRKRVLVFAGIHAMEWISTETATAFVLEMAQMPPDGVEIVVIPLLNPDGRLRVERDLLDGRNRFQRTNAKRVDLNRDFGHNRQAKAVWRHLLPSLYSTSPGSLSQPESRAIDGLAATGFDVAISLHAFGGFFYYPWAGLWKRPADHETFVRLGRVMAQAQGSHAYKVRQLSRWGFFFRAHGAEIDHIYGEYGTLAFLIELSRSGLNPLRPKTLWTHFRWYNPARPDRHVDKGVSALRALVGTLSWESWEPIPHSFH